MFDLIYPFLAFVVAYFVLAWLVGRKEPLALDHPNARSLHASPVPRIGGLGLMAGMLAVMPLLQSAGLTPLLLAVLALAGLSWLDDVRGLSVRVRLPAHLLVAAVFLVLEGGNSVVVLVLGALLIVWMTNLYNFMDGADGLAGGMAIAGFTAYGAAAWLGGAQDLALACLSIAAAALAFLRFNFPPAGLFLGDSGSIPLGFLAAGLGWLGVRDGLWPPGFPLLAFSPFILDASVTLMLRLGRGEKVWQAHRSHYYQRLVRMGWSHRRLALAEYALMGMTGGSALLLVRHPDWQLAVVSSWAIVYLVLVVLIDRRWKESGLAN